MAMLLHELLEKSAERKPNKNVLGIKKQWITYQALQVACNTAALAFHRLGVCKAERVAIYLPKVEKAVISYFSVSQIGGIFIPVNSALKAQQVTHILNDSTAKVLVTNKARLQQILTQLADNISGNKLSALEYIIVTDNLDKNELATNKRLLNGLGNNSIKLLNWCDFIRLRCHNSGGNYLDHVDNSEVIHRDIIDSDIAAIFYTSGSTGNAKGVVLSHRNLVMGAKSIAKYLPCKSADIMAAIQPFSFDYGFSQLTLCFHIGASCYMDEYLFEKDLFNTIVTQKITTLALVPPLWIKLAQQVWPPEVGESIRYFCNTGGAMPTVTLNALRKNMTNAEPYLMYGLTEAFRSCYLPPEQIDIRPESFGKAIPNAQISVINDQGQECEPHEHGELVHSGILVSQGYWNDIEKTKQRFKPAPHKLPQIALPEIAVWSGDMVTKDEEGFLYFVGRKDDLIKTSGYRVSPDEVENALYLLDDISEAIVIGVSHPVLGQALVAVIVAKSKALTEKKVLRHCLSILPNYMLPKHIVFVASLPRNANNKFERNSWAVEYKSLFEAKATEDASNKGNLNENT